MTIPTWSESADRITILRCRYDSLHLSCSMLRLEQDDITWVAYRTELLLRYGLRLNLCRLYLPKVGNRAEVGQAKFAALAKVNGSFEILSPSIHILLTCFLKVKSLWLLAWLHSNFDCIFFGIHFDWNCVEVQRIVQTIVTFYSQQSVCQIYVWRMSFFLHKTVNTPQKHEKNPPDSLLSVNIMPRLTMV